ncbi:MAG TPA: hypothetical protein VN947_13060 [Polyangia bacterium]|nr:hypothetical protein [Polyangia bacterium]
MRALGLTMILLPSMALAQPALPAAAAPVPVPQAAPMPPPLPPLDDGECTVTTTVHCTGAAAPYAVQAAQPQAPVVVPPVVVAPPAPPPPAPPVAVPPASAPPQIMYLDTRHLVGDGWKLTQSPDGRLWRERKVSTPSNAMWGGGLALWITSYLAGGIGGMASDGFGEIAWWPVLGPFVAAGFSSDGTGKALFAVDGLLQGTGFVLFLVGLAAGPEKLERLPVSVGPIGFAGGGSGVALSTRF